jgi:hypothetical protein
MWAESGPVSKGNSQVPFYATIFDFCVKLLGKRLHPVYFTGNQRYATPSPISAHISNGSEQGTMFFDLDSEEKLASFQKLKLKCPLLESEYRSLSLPQILK